MNYRLYKGNFRGYHFMISFRIAHFLHKHIFLRIVGFPFLLFYRFVYNYLLSIDIHESTCIGESLVVWHGMGLVVHPKTQIGNYVILHQNTTLGNSHPGGPAPVIEDYVNIGCNCCILGGITIGHNSIIGAGSVVVKDIPAYSVVVGNPAKVIKNNK